MQSLNQQLTNSRPGKPLSFSCGLESRLYIEHAPFSGVLTVEHSKGLPVSLGMEACMHACVYLEGSC